MLDDKGNTAVYLLYMYTRIKSIGRGAELDENKILDMCKNETLQLNHEKEWKLAKVSFFILLCKNLSEFPNQSNVLFSFWTDPVAISRCHRKNYQGSVYA